MIGCEKLCGRCGDCAPFVAALDYDAPPKTGCGCRECAARAAIAAPASLADLLARALRGRGVGASGAIADGRIYIYHTESGGPHANDYSPSAKRARSALSRLLAAGLCSADEAMRLLEGP